MVRVRGWPAEKCVVPPLPLRSALKALLSSTAVSVGLIARGRIRQPATHLGRRVAFADGSEAAVYRETVIDRPPPDAPVVLVVTFRRVDDWPGKGLVAVRPDGFVGYRSATASPSGIRSWLALIAVRSPPHAV